MPTMPKQDPASNCDAATLVLAREPEKPHLSPRSYISLHYETNRGLALAIHRPMTPLGVAYNFSDVKVVLARQTGVFVDAAGFSWYAHSSE